MILQSRSLTAFGSLPTLRQRNVHCLSTGRRVYR
nr:MAG TPA: hypothetical protein [Caudoviricetes sp.]